MASQTLYKLDFLIQFLALIKLFLLNNKSNQEKLSGHLALRFWLDYKPKDNKILG